MDRRTTPATGRIAHISLQGQIAAPEFTDGQALQVLWPLVDLLDQPDGRRQRQLWMGEGFTVIDRDRGHAFGMAAKDGYCGWLPEKAVGPAPDPTHWVAATGSHLYTEARIQAPQISTLPMGARLRVGGQTDRFAKTTQGFVPSIHLRPIGDCLPDPVAVAESFLATPYLWGGNSRAGLDCSGLVQVAFLACGKPCPGDSDMQQSLGRDIPADDPTQRGDLLFWPGHVAMAVDENRLVHANAHSMTVAIENINATINRIQNQDGGMPKRRRP